MKLYYSPLACSFAVDIALREAGLEFTLERVDTRQRRTASGDDYGKINPKGYVPALALGDGRVLTECPVVLQYVADLAPAAKLAPPAGSFDRYRLKEWLGFIASELHKCFGPLFDPKERDDVKAAARERAGRWLDHVERGLEGRQHLLGDDFTVADCYAYAVVNWTKFTGISLDERPNLARYVARIEARPAVRAAFAAETGKR